MLYYSCCQTPDSLLSSNGRLLTTKQNYKQLQGQRLLKRSSVQKHVTILDNLNQSMKKVWAVRLSIFRLRFADGAEKWNENGHWQTTSRPTAATDKLPSARHEDNTDSDATTSNTVCAPLCTTQPLGGASWLPFHSKSPHALSLLTILSLVSINRAWLAVEVVSARAISKLPNLFLVNKHHGPFIRVFVRGGHVGSRNRKIYVCPSAFMADILTSFVDCNVALGWYPTCFLSGDPP